MAVVFRGDTLLCDAAYFIEAMPRLAIGRTCCLIGRKRGGLHMGGGQHCTCQDQRRCDGRANSQERTQRPDFYLDLAAFKNARGVFILAEKYSQLFPYFCAKARAGLDAIGFFDSVCHWAFLRSVRGMVKSPGKDGSPVPEAPCRLAM